MTERPNICYIFEKLGVQGCQIWHSHVSMPFNSAPAHSTHPHNAKKSSLRYHFSRNSWKFGSQKLLPHDHFWWGSRFSYFSLPSGPRGMFEPIVTNSDTSNTHKHPKTPTSNHKTPTNTHKEWCYHTFVKEWMKALDKTGILAPSDYFYHFSFPSYGRLKSKTNFSNVFLRPCSLIPLMHCS